MSNQTEALPARPAWSAFGQAVAWIRAILIDAGVPPRGPRAGAQMDARQHAAAIAAAGWVSRPAWDAALLDLGYAPHAPDRLDAFAVVSSFERADRLIAALAYNGIEIGADPLASDDALEAVLAQLTRPSRPGGAHARLRRIFARWKPLGARRRRHAAVEGAR